MIIGTIPSAFVCAEELSEEDQYNPSIVKVTNEPTMPLRDEILLYSTGETVSKRDEWIKEVIEINESAYNQTITDVEENDDYYIFNFEPNPDLEDKIIMADGEEYINVQIDRILYVKPESAINNSDISPNSSVIPDVGGTAGSTKIVEYYGWSNGYKKYDEKSGLLGSIFDLLIGFVPTESVTVSWLLSLVFGSFVDTLTSNQFVKAESYNKYYYRNKAGCVYNTTLQGWLPIAHVGERRSFGWAWGTYKNSYGEPILKKASIKNANNSKNPTNYDSREKKNHYDDYSWIINKAKETQNTGGYWDCFAIVTTLY